MILFSSNLLFSIVAVLKATAQVSNRIGIKITYSPFLIFGYNKNAIVNRRNEIATMKKFSGCVTCKNGCA